MYNVIFVVKILSPWAKSHHSRNIFAVHFEAHDGIEKLTFLQNNASFFTSAWTTTGQREEMCV
jgi:hypothetical protein